MAKGKVYLIGAGSGDPDLITVKGGRLLKKADVIIFDYLVNKKLLRFSKKSCKKISVKALGRLGATAFCRTQDKINQTMIDFAAKGKMVVRLKSGDPFTFGRGGQEAEALAKAQVTYEVIPGVTTALAAAAGALVPLTDRRFASSVSLIAGHETPSKTKNNQGTLVFYMGIKTLPKIVARLIKNGSRDKTPVLIVENASLRTERITVGTLGNIVNKAQQKKITAPAIIIVGAVVKLREKLCVKKS